MSSVTSGPLQRKNRASMVLAMIICLSPIFWCNIIILVKQILGSSAAVRAMLRQVELVAPVPSTVLIRGETGTGKELIACAIHDGSPRRAGPFVPVHLASLPPTLIASELFGHEKGAFTGATEQQPGQVELAKGGTLFLDEIGDLPPEVQVMLLRFLQEREFQRVGGRRWIRADVRLVAATNRDLEKLVREGRFRDDLYFRFNVFPLLAPPLRERKEDIPTLIGEFVRRFSQKIGKRFDHVDRQTLLVCQDYPWPGNVRELENLVERTVILCPEPVFTMNPFTADAAAPGGEFTSLHAIIRAHIIRALKLCGGKIYGDQGAARLLGLKPSTLQAKIQRLGIDRAKLID